MIFLKSDFLIHQLLITILNIYVMNKKIHKAYLYLFAYSLIVVVATRFLFDQAVWRILLLFMFPITLCYLIWALKEYSFRNRLYISMGISIICILFWYDFSSLNIFIVAPFLSSALALLSGYYIERKL